MRCAHCNRLIRSWEPWALAGSFLPVVSPKLPYGSPVVVCSSPACAVAALGTFPKKLVLVKKSL